ncbi:hypothetical protein MTO96_025676 [Rhipicephalus appendiculatus]
MRFRSDVVASIRIAERQSERGLLRATYQSIEAFGVHPRGILLGDFLRYFTDDGQKLRFAPLGSLGKLRTEAKHITNTAGKFKTFGDVDVTHYFPTVLVHLNSELPQLSLPKQFSHPVS